LELVVWVENYINLTAQPTIEDFLYSSRYSRNKSERLSSADTSYFTEKVFNHSFKWKIILVSWGSEIELCSSQWLFKGQKRRLHREGKVASFEKSKYHHDLVGQNKLRNFICSKGWNSFMLKYFLRKKSFNQNDSVIFLSHNNQKLQSFFCFSIRWKDKKFMVDKNIH